MKETVIITGASKGIGKACAVLFANKGYNVVVNYNSSQKEALALVEELLKVNRNVMAIKADVSKACEVESLVACASERFGSIDVLVNNAGISSKGLFTECDDKVWDDMIGVNLMGVVNCSKAVVPLMIQRKYGKIVNISSVWGVTGASCEVVYSTVKAAVIGLTKSLAKELGPSNINVNCIAPGLIATNMNSLLSSEDISSFTEDTPLMRIGEPEDVANAVFYLASKESSYITGQVFNVDGGYVI